MKSLSIILSFIALHAAAAPRAHAPTDGAPIQNVKPKCVRHEDLKCGKWETEAVDVGNTTALNKVDCHNRCLGTPNCDISQFNPRYEEENCLFFNSKVIEKDLFVTYAYDEVACSTTFNGVEPPFPLGGCSQFLIYGEVIEKPEGEKIRVNTVEECAAKCKARSDCTHALVSLAPGDPIGYCNFFKEDPEGDELYFLPNESICPV